jgi:hypothetical protein
VQLTTNIVGDAALRVKNPPEKNFRRGPNDQVKGLRYAVPESEANGLNRLLDLQL